MRYDEVVADVTARGGPTQKHEAEAVIQIVLEDLGKRLKGNEPQNLADQLPAELKEPLVAHTEQESTTDDVDEFLRRVAEHEGEGVSPEEALPHVRAVFTSLASFISEGETQAIRSQLPAGFAPLFQ